MLLNYIINTQIGKVRNLNEDYAAVFQMNKGLLAIVCDGLGGNKAGSVASSMAVNTFYSYFSTLDEKNVLKRIEQSANLTNSAIFECSNANEEYRGMATTAEFLYIEENTAYWGHIGDSSIFYYHLSDLIKITKDHSVVQKLVDLGVITNKEAKMHPHKNVILNALGDNLDFQIDLNYLKLKAKQEWKFLLCTDGVTGVMEKDEIRELLSNNNLKEISESLNEIITNRGAPDNFSYIIISNKG